MKRICIVLGLSAFAFGLHAQVVDLTVCEALKNPQSFDGKIVRIKGTVAAEFDQFVVKGIGCGQNVNAIWLSYPEGTKAKAGPVALLQLQPARNFAGQISAVARTPVTLEKNKDFKQFDSLLSTPHKVAGMCLGCTRYEVSATLVGRLDGVAEAGVRRDQAGKIVHIGGFGNLNAYNVRLVIQSVSDVSPTEIDFSKTDGITKFDMPVTSGGAEPVNTDPTNPVAAAHKSALAFGAGNIQGAKIERAAAAFGRLGEHNGVSIGYGVTNEAPAKQETQDVHDSPDGVLFNCTFNMGRLPGDALSRAIVHIGQHVADLRNPSDGSEKASLAELEYQAWVTTALDAAANGQKTLALPGSYLLWNSAWSDADRDKLMNDNLSKYIANKELLMN
jgi:hypothetical protein